MQKPFGRQPKAPTSVSGVKPGAPDVGTLTKKQLSLKVLGTPTKQGIGVVSKLPTGTANSLHIKPTGMPEPHIPKIVAPPSNVAAPPAKVEATTPANVAAPPAKVEATTPATPAKPAIHTTTLITNAKEILVATDLAKIVASGELPNTPPKINTPPNTTPPTRASKTLTRRTKKLKRKTEELAAAANAREQKIVIAKAKAQKTTNNINAKISQLTANATTKHNEIQSKAISNLVKPLANAETKIAQFTKKAEAITSKADTAIENIKKAAETQKAIPQAAFENAKTSIEATKTKKLAAIIRKPRIEISNDDRKSTDNRTRKIIANIEEKNAKMDANEKAQEEKINASANEQIAKQQSTLDKEHNKINDLTEIRLQPHERAKTKINIATQRITKAANKPIEAIRINAEKQQAKIDASILLKTAVLTDTKPIIPQTADEKQATETATKAAEAAKIVEAENIKIAETTAALELAKITVDALNTTQTEKQKQTTNATQAKQSVKDASNIVSAITTKLTAIEKQIIEQTNFANNIATNTNPNKIDIQGKIAIEIATANLQKLLLEKTKLNTTLEEAKKVETDAVNKDTTQNLELHTNTINDKIDDHKGKIVNINADIAKQTAIVNDATKSPKEIADANAQIDKLNIDKTVIADALKVAETDKTKAVNKKDRHNLSITINNFKINITTNTKKIAELDTQILATQKIIDDTSKTPEEKATAIAKLDTLNDAKTVATTALAKDTTELADKTKALDLIPKSAEEILADAKLANNTLAATQLTLTALTAPKILTPDEIAKKKADEFTKITDTITKNLEDKHATEKTALQAQMQSSQQTIDNLQEQIQDLANKQLLQQPQQQGQTQQQFQQQQERYTQDSTAREKERANKIEELNAAQKVNQEYHERDQHGNRKMGIFKRAFKQLFSKGVYPDDIEKMTEYINKGLDAKYNKLDTNKVMKQEQKNAIMNEEYEKAAAKLAKQNLEGLNSKDSQAGGKYNSKSKLTKLYKSKYNSRSKLTKIYKTQIN